MFFSVCCRPIMRFFSDTHLKQASPADTTLKPVRHYRTVPHVIAELLRRKLLPITFRRIRHIRFLSASLDPPIVKAVLSCCQTVRGFEAKPHIVVSHNCAPIGKETYSASPPHAEVTIGKNVQICGCETSMTRRTERSWIGRKTWARLGQRTRSNWRSILRFQERKSSRINTT